MYLLERLGRHPLIEGLEDGFSFGRGQFFDDVGNIGGVQPC